MKWVELWALCGFLQAAQLSRGAGLLFIQSVMGIFLPNLPPQGKHRGCLTWQRSWGQAWKHWIGVFLCFGVKLFWLTAQESCSRGWARLALESRGTWYSQHFSGAAHPPWIAVLANKYLQLGTESCNSGAIFCPSVNTVRCYCNFPLTELSCQFGIFKIYQTYPFKSKVTLHQRWFPVYVLCSFNSQLTCLRIYM